MQRLLWLCLTLAAINLVSYSLWTSGAISAAETGQLEAGQSIFLLLACLLHSYHSRANKMCFIARYGHCGLALFCFALFLREMDIDKMGHIENADLWRALELMMRSLTLVGFLVCGKLFLKHPRINILHVKRFLSTPTAFFSLCGCVTYLCGWPFDKLLFGIPDAVSVWAEETVEFDAACLFLYAALTPFSIGSSSLLPDLVHDSRR